MLRSPRHRTYNPASRNPRSKSPYKPKPIRRTNRKRSPFRRAWHASAIGRFAHSGTVRRFRRRPKRAGTACPQGFLPGAKILPRRFPERQRSSLPTRQHRIATAYSSPSASATAKRSISPCSSPSTAGSFEQEVADTAATRANTRRKLRNGKVARICFIIYIDII